MANVQTFTARTTYRRQARRLRASLRQDTTAMHRALGELATSSDRPVPLPIQPRKPVVASLDAHPYFAALVTRQLNKGCFTQTDRVQLLAVAGKLGIDRFTANLIVAARQHATVPRPSDRPPADLPPVASPVGVVVAFMLVQAMIVTVAIWLCRM